MGSDNKEKEINVEIIAESDLLDNDNLLTLNDVTPKLEKYWFQYPQLLKLNILLLSGILTLTTSGFDSSMMNNLQNLPSWSEYFNHPSGGTLGTMSNGVSIGQLCAVPVGYLLPGYLGRRPTLMIGGSIVILGAGIQAGSTNFGMFVASRIIIGFGVSLSSIGSGPIVTETAYPTQRAIMTTFLTASWPLGAFIAALVTWGPYMSDMRYDNWSWRLPSLLQGAFPIFIVILAFFGPESPRWLIAHGKSEQARKVLIEFHGFGDEDSPLVKFQMAEITAAIDNEKLMNGGWGEWFRSKANRHRLFIVLGIAAMQQLCGNALVSYYLSIILNNIGFTEPAEKLKINIGITVYGLAWGVVAAIYSNRFKRKTLFMVGFGSMGFIFIIWIILSAINQQRNFEDKSLGNGVVAMIFLFQGFYHISHPVTLTYVMEILPYSLRAKGATLYQMATGATLLFNNYVNNIAMDAIQWRYYIVWCVWLFVQTLVIYFFFPETHGLGLEEIAQVFGEDISEVKKAGDNAIKEKGFEAYNVEQGTNSIENISNQKSNAKDVV